MIASFNIENYLSFKKHTKINFIPASIKEYKDNVYVNLLRKEIQTLKTIAVFGHNAHGKTNIIKAISFMKDFVLNSSKESLVNKDIPVEPFRLSVETETLPSSFELDFYLDGNKYRYGFSVTSKEVKEEWLFVSSKKKEEFVFIRAGKNYSVDKKFKNEIKGKFELFEEITRPNSLFLSVLAQFNNILCLSISKYFSNILIVRDTDHQELINFTARLMSEGEYRGLINETIFNAKLGIDKVEEKIKEISAKTKFTTDFLSTVFEDEMKEYSVKTIHSKYQDDRGVVGKITFDLLTNESFGTQKFFGLLGVVLFALKEKKPLFIDEMDARIHTALFEVILSLFNSNRYNQNGAQLLFTAHNINILKKGLRRDQMSFVEKNEFGESQYASLYVKDPKIRNDASFEKDYLSGRYGAIIKPSEQLDLFRDL